MVEASIFYLFIIIPLWALQSSCLESRNCENNTINDFWHESLDNCRIDVKNVLDIFDKISDKKETNDQFSELLRYHIENTLKDFMVQEIIATISLESLDNENHLSIFNEDFTENHKTLSRFVWTKALDDLTQTMDVHKLLQQILLIPNERLKFDILEYIWQKFGIQFKTNSKFIQIMAFALISLLRKTESLTTSQVIQADAILNQLPQTLLTVYQAWNYNVSLVNHHYNEYMFADPDKGPSPQQRFLFTYIRPKSSLNVQGKLKLFFNPQGLVALSLIFKGSRKFLKREHDRVYFCLDCESNDEDLHWWNIVWSSENLNENQSQYIYLQSPDTGNLLCATTEYDQYRRWVQNLSVKDYRMVKACQWKVIKKNR